MSDEIRELSTDSDIQVRDAAKRELDARLLRWDVPIDTTAGRELFARGAFAETDPSKVRLMGLSHEVRLGLRQDGQTPKLVRIPTGKGVALEERDDGPYMTFRVAKTQAGDEILALAEDGLVSGVSIEFSEVPGGSVVETRSGRRTTVHKRVLLQGVSTTDQPAYGEHSAVVAVRSEEGEAPVSETTTTTETTTAPAPPVAFDISPLTSAVGQAVTEMRSAFDERLVKLEEARRTDILIPAKEPAKPQVRMGDWLQTVLRIKSGEHVAEAQMRDLDDLITTDNIGVVPPAYSTELIGVINRVRPFLATTRRLETPAAGVDLKLPKLVTRPETGVQANEKDELASNVTEIEVATFGMTTIGGAGDISLQLLKRSSPEFLSLYLELLAESLSANAEIEAIATLLADPDINDNGGAHTALDPEDLDLGVAWANAFDAIIAPPDTLWMNSDAIAAFIDAKATTTNQPLYGSITANATAGGGVSGSISGLRVVHVPAMNSSGVDVIAGPSRGFAWAEDGAYTLQVDVPAKAGRDVALVSMYFFAPLYPAAFTTFTV